MTRDVIGTVAFVPDRDDQIFVSPSVGVTHEPIERLVAGLTAQKTIRATLPTNVGYLTPDHAYLMFTVAEDSDPAARIQELMSIVHRVCSSVGLSPRRS